MPASESERAQARALSTQGEPVAVELRTHEGRTSAGTLRRKELSPEERAARSRRWLITFLLVAPLAAVVPPHFPWLLAMIAVAIGGSRARGRAAVVILGGEGTCPACGAWQLLDGGAPEFPMAHYCSECKARALITPSAQPPPTG